MLEHLLQDAKTFGFKLIQLDSAGFMDTAHHIYQSYGFKVIDPYPESEIPDKFKKHWIFMEADVSDLKLNK